MPRDEEVDFYDVKGALENLWKAWECPEVAFVPSGRAVSPSGQICGHDACDGETSDIVGEAVAC